MSESPSHVANGELNNDKCAEEIEKWLDEHPEFVHSYFTRKVGRSLLSLSRTRPRTPSKEATPPTSGTSTPVRKISASDLDTSMRGILKPIISVVDGQTSFLSPEHHTMRGKRFIVRKSKEELSRLDETELMMELVKDISEDLELRSLCHKILQNVSILLNGDRCSMFLVQGSAEGPRYLVSTVFDVNADSKVEDLDNVEEIRVPWGTGVVGYVAEKGETVNIANAYEDERFNEEIDQRTGYKTRSILCMPVRNGFGEVIAVSQVINKHGKINHTFTAEDEKTFSRFLAFCGVAIHNAELYETAQKEIKRNQVLLDLAKTIFEEQCTLENIVHKIMMITQSLLQCERCSVLLVDQYSKNLFSRAFDLEAKDIVYDEENSTLVRTRKSSRTEVSFPINIGITGHVATTGQTLNIPDAYSDPRFDPEVDEITGFKTKTILCMPIQNSLGDIIGVVQLLNKMDNTPFNTNDENLFEAFAIFCGMAIHNTRVYEDVQKAMAKQRVAFEILSYHAIASPDEATKLKNKSLALSKVSRSLLDFGFDDDTLDDLSTCRATLTMFYELNLHNRFDIDEDVLCRWIMSVKKNYRQVKYHNWRHAFNVGQTMYAIIKASNIQKYFSDVERLALLVACLCHDLDHRGTNNSFQVKIDSPLARLYSTSTMEHHHFDHCVMILHSSGNEIFAGLTTEQYEQAFKMLEWCILATDLALYFRNRNRFLEYVKDGSVDWSDPPKKELLSAMLMTACDVSAITKPWAVQRRVAKLVSEEFFLQGDLEIEELKEQPIDMMDRGKKEKLPEMQLGFIDGICLPVYKAFADICPNLKPLLDGVLENRNHWKELAETQKRKIQGTQTRHK